MKKYLVIIFLVVLVGTIAVGFYTGSQKKAAQNKLIEIDQKIGLKTEAIKQITMEEKLIPDLYPILSAVNNCYENNQLSIILEKISSKANNIKTLNFEAGILEIDCDEETIKEIKTTFPELVSEKYSETNKVGLNFNKKIDRIDPRNSSQINFAELRQSFGFALNKEIENKISELEKIENQFLDKESNLKRMKALYFAYRDTVPLLVEKSRNTSMKDVEYSSFLNTIFNGSSLLENKVLVDKPELKKQGITYEVKCVPKYLFDNIKSLESKKSLCFINKINYVDGSAKLEFVAYSLSLE